MKKLLLALVLLMVCLTGCANNNNNNNENADTVTTKVNTNGIGSVGVGEADEIPEFDPEFPSQSYVLNTEKGTKLTLVAFETDEEWKFVKWQKDGADFSTDMQVSVTADADTEYIAVFMMSGSYDGPVIDNIADAKTIGDVLGLPTYGYSLTEDRFILGFELNGAVYRAVADLDKETSEKLFSLNFDDPEYDKKFNELLAPLTITHLVDVNSLVPSQDQVDKYVGKTGEELLNDGWTYNYYNFETMEFGMNYGLFAYIVKFDGKVEYKEDMDIDEAIKPLKVLSVTYEGIGDVTNPEYIEIEG